MSKNKNNPIKEILIDERSGFNLYEEDQSSGYLKGWFEQDKVIYEKEEGCKKLISFLKDFKSIQNVKEFISSLSGNFSFIFQDNVKLISSVDKVRTTRIFYSNLSNEFCISNSARNLQTIIDLYQKDTLSLLEFSMAGYVTGPRTLYKGLMQLEAGEMLLWDKKIKKLETSKYYKFWSDRYNNKTEKDLLEEYHEISLKVFDIYAREVATVINNKILPPGKYVESFYANNNNISSGVYYFLFSTPQKTITKKMTYIK